MIQNVMLHAISYYTVTFFSTRDDPDLQFLFLQKFILSCLSNLCIVSPALIACKFGLGPYVGKRITHRILVAVRAIFGAASIFTSTHFDLLMLKVR